MRLSWGVDRNFESGLDRGVLYPKVDPAIPWQGLVSIDDEVSGETNSLRYIDGIAYTMAQGIDSYAATLVSFVYPDEIHDDTVLFDFSYRTLVDSDISSGYKLHLVYNAQFNPADIKRDSINNSTQAINFELELSTVPLNIYQASPSAHLIIDSRLINPDVLPLIEDILYGTDESDPRMPLPEELVPFIDSHATLIITDYGDGTWSAEGPDDVVFLLDATTFEISWPSAMYINSEKYRVSTL